MRIGLVEVGRIGAFHAATLKGLDCVEQVVVAGADPARAQAVAKALDCDVAADVEALFRADLDAVAICAQTSSHAELIGLAQDAGLTTFCEKPLASDLASTLLIAGRVGDDSVPVQIGFQRRFDVDYLAARSAVISGSLGGINTICATPNDAAPPHASYIPTSGGFFRDCSIRDFDAVRFVTGREIVSVFAGGQNRGAAFFAQFYDIDAAAAVLTLDDGAIARISGSRYNARGYDVRLEALGSKDSVCVGMDDRLPLRSVEKRVDFPSAMPYTDFMEQFDQGHVDELDAFTEPVAGRIETPCSAGEALGAFRGAEACDLSRPREAFGTDGGGGPLMTTTDRLAGAPISWSACEVPGWGRQLDSATVLSQMQDVGVVATEFGPHSFLPNDPPDKAKMLADKGLSAVGGFVPVVLHDADLDPVREIEQALAGFTALGAGTLVLAAATGTDAYHARFGLDDDGWQVLLRNLDRIDLLATRMGNIATVHPDVGTMVETADDVERVLEGCGVGPCLDTGHLLVGGADPVVLPAGHAGRIRHTHPKDVDAIWATRVQSGDVTYTDALRGGMHRPLGQGDVNIASIVGSLERSEYDGWYPLEKDRILTGPPQTGHHGPLADVRVSDHLCAIAEALA
jgi:predicted dehydrogenase/sugar phosphate isomerase/epimerase